MIRIGRVGLILFALAFFFSKFRKNAHFSFTAELYCSYNLEIDGSSVRDWSI